MTTMTISQLARRSGLTASTLRYYEQLGVMPPAERSESGYRLYDDTALARLAFVQRAKTLGIDLGDVAELVRLWDGEQCAPVQDRLRSLVHGQRSVARERLTELTQLATELDAVGESIGDAACGPGCACVQPLSGMTATSPTAPERMIGAACDLSSDEMRVRLAEWRRVREAAASVEVLADGARLTFDASEPMGPLADLLARESECCAFYTFTLRIDGPARYLEIGAGPGGAPAVDALIGAKR